MRGCQPEDMPFGDLWDDDPEPVQLEAEIGPGPEVLGHLYLPNGEIGYTLLSHRPVRFGFRRPEDCYE
jgi:hypothetical protein